MTIHEFIKNRPYLIWYVNDYDSLNEDSIVEHTLNYGDFDDVKKLIEIMSVEKVAEIFRRNSDNNNFRSNYDDKIKNYFNLYFDKYTPRDID